MTTDLRLHEPAFLPAAAVAGLEDIGRVDGNAVVGVVQRGKVEAGAAKINCLGVWKVKPSQSAWKDSSNIFESDCK